MSTDNVVLDEYQNGSPPSPKSGSPTSSPRVAAKTTRQRSRSRSPLSRQRIYDSEGTNTTSDQPHLQRARLFVGNVDQRIHRSELRRIFAQYGEVIGVSIHKGFAFVQMDRERHANDAIVGEDNRMLNGSRLHVEFSQAAKKAGARFEPGQVPLGGVRRGRSPLSSSRGHRDPYLDELEEREAKLARIIAMEKELAYIRSQDHFSRSPPRDTYDRQRNYSPPRREYERSSYDRRGSYYDRQSPPVSPATKSGPGPFRESFPKRDPGYEPRESMYGRGGEPSVGYGASSGRMSGGKASGGPPPGWPTTSFGKSTPNQRPFSGSSSWN